jgi:hypothetical protein
MLFIIIIIIIFFFISKSVFHFLTVTLTTEPVVLTVKRKMQGGSQGKAQNSCLLRNLDSSNQSAKNNKINVLIILIGTKLSFNCTELKEMQEQLCGVPSSKGTHQHPLRHHSNQGDPLVWDKQDKHHINKLD